jgi:hypothetical protein
MIDSSDRTRTGTRRLRAAALAASAIGGLVISMGTASAADPWTPDWHGDPGWHDPGSTHSSSKTEVHNSGSGPVAVQSGGGSQYANQTRTDNSKHSYYKDGSRRSDSTTENSHNSTDHRDSHNTRHPDPGPGPGPWVG